MFKDPLRRLNNIYKYLCVKDQIQCTAVVQTHSTNVRSSTEKKYIIGVSIHFTISCDTCTVLSFEM